MDTILCVVYFFDIHRWILFSNRNGCENLKFLPRIKKTIIKKHNSNQNSVVKTSYFIVLHSAMTFVTFFVTGRIKSITTVKYHLRRMITQLSGTN